MTLEPGQWQDALEFDGGTLSTVHGPRWRLVLIGAGQLTQYLAEMARMLDYHVSVIEPREEYASGWSVADIALDRRMPDDVIAANLDGHSAVVALTHDPKIDDLALMKALKSAAFYVGAIGSKKNNDARRQRLKEFDLSEGEIARLRGPVGLYIGSKTPPEIAVAIVAEMTAVRHGVTEPSWAAKKGSRFDPSACEVQEAGQARIVSREVRSLLPWTLRGSKTGTEKTRSETGHYRAIDSRSRATHSLLPEIHQKQLSFDRYGRKLSKGVLCVNTVHKREALP